MVKLAFIVLQHSTVTLYNMKIPLKKQVNFSNKYLKDVIKGAYRKCFMLLESKQ